MVEGRPVREVLLAYGAATLACALAAHGLAAAGLEAFVSVAVGAILLFGAIHLAQRSGGLVRHGIDLGGLLSPPAEGDEAGPLGLFDLARVVRRGLGPAARELAVALGISALIFPPFAAGYVAWFGLEGTFRLVPPPDLAAFALTQVVLVALPEEAFFRGYVQTRLGDAWPAGRGILRAEVAFPVLILQATLFALLHIVSEPVPSRLAVFFPALLFGWLRARRGGIGAAVFFHAFCNVYSEVLARSLH
ncbi:MAG: MrtC family glutamic-type intramembrane protease [Polyangiales bacterium]